MFAKKPAAAVDGCHAVGYVARAQHEINFHGTEMHESSLEQKGLGMYVSN